MRNSLAERLLAKVMHWSAEDVSTERPILQFLANYKYDEYQQFSPGIRFIESLAIWLSQFPTLEEKQIAYKFVRERLVFLSSSEMSTLVSSLYPDYIKNILISEVSELLRLPKYKVNAVIKSEEFRKTLRSSLFLGLSDGAKIDIFRRSSQDISNEQVFAFYDVSKEKLSEALNDLNLDLKEDGGAKFSHLFLIDDFAGSGMSYLRDTKDGHKGKINKIVSRLSGLEKSIINDDACFHIVLYVCTAQAEKHLEALLKEYFSTKSYRYSLIIIQRLDESFPIGVSDFEILSIIKNPNYYDPTAEDKHTEVGGTRKVDLGFAGCALPLVLSHNTPNTSIFLLWSDRRAFRNTGLFPRMSRHKENLEVAKKDV